jgi:hypothetical protein
MRILIVASCIFLAGGATTAAARTNVMDMKNWTIVVADGALPSERYGATEFQSLFKGATGVELPIASTSPGKKYNVFIGASAAMKESPARFAVGGLGEEGLHIRIKPHNIAIAGGPPRGTLYGVYEFFEKYFGVRFLTCDDTYFPPASELKPLPRSNYTYRPPFSFRYSYYKENAERPEFAARLRVNTVTNDEKLGGVTHQSLINHSLFKWISPAEFGQTHPEYFALVNGERKLDAGGGGPEPCVTNPEVIDIVAERVIKELDANPNQQNFSVSQNDNNLYCHCPRCEEINQREGTPMGAHLMFVNAVAERVERKHPNVKIGTLAYWYTRKAPKTVVPRKNVQIQLCSIECCTYHTINDQTCKRNRKFCEDMAAWKAICNDIWVWNYNTDFACYDLPFPNLRSIGANVRFFLNNNVKGVFMQANGNGTSGEMSDLRNYVIANCLWKPGQGSWPLVEEFCRLHYKSAAQPILDYLTMIHDNVAAKHLHPGCFPSAEEVGLTPEISQKALAYFDEALGKADDDIVRQRVEKASICAYKAMILAGGGRWRYENGFCRREWSEPRYQGLIDRYMDLCRKHKMTMATEGTAVEQYFEQLKRQNNLAAVQLENPIWRLTFLPEENGKLVEMLHKPTTRNFLAAMTHDDILRGTHQEVAVKGYEHEKPTKFDVQVEGTSANFAKTLEDGSVIQRRVTLSPQDPEKIAFEWTLTHTGPAPKTYQVKARPEFDPGSNSDKAEVVSVYVKNGGWTRINREWKDNSGPDEEILEKAKGGGFAFFNHESGFGTLVTYDPAKVDHPSLRWNPERPQVNLEVFSPAVELKTGESLSLNYKFEYLKEPPR